jgi:biopolymer transport protein ExbB/TolQ
MNKNRLSDRQFLQMSHSPRQELEVSIPLVLTLAAALTGVIYAIFLERRQTYLGTLLYDRGFTQVAVLFFAGIVLSFTILKFVKLQREFFALRENWVAVDLDWHDPQSPLLFRLQERLLADGSAIARRCARAIAAYIHSGNRKAAAELALDDSSFYLSASESSYSLPRILVWAIPLLGFIGTVIGISQAVTGFSGFLEEAGEIDQIKEGIGTVTSGLAVAFDTTLVALFLSVLVMIPLVLVERFESRLLLAIDIYLNDRLLPRFKDSGTPLKNEQLTQAIDAAIARHLPSPEALIDPARTYAERAAEVLSQTFIAQLNTVQTQHEKLIERLDNLQEKTLEERQAFELSFSENEENYRQAIADLIAEINGTYRKVSAEMEAGNRAIAQNLIQQAEKIGDRLEHASKSLDSRIALLEKSKTNIAQILELQERLDKNLRSIARDGHIEVVLTEIREHLSELKPLLKQLNKPRRITLVETEDKIE